jgi:hypothetical protein
MWRDGRSDGRISQVDVKKKPGMVKKRPRWLKKRTWWLMRKIRPSRS